MNRFRTATATISGSHKFTLGAIVILVFIIVDINKQERGCEWWWMSFLVEEEMLLNIDILRSFRFNFMFITLSVYT